MISQSKWVSAAVLIALVAGISAAADTVSAGLVKSVNADRKTFVLTDAGQNDRTYKLGETVVVNRDGKEGRSDLRAGDAVSVCYAKGLLSRTARYVLVKEGSGKGRELVSGSFKGYDAGTRRLTYTSADGKDAAFALGDAKVRRNGVSSTIEEFRIGDSLLAIMERDGDTLTPRAVMAGHEN